VKLKPEHVEEYKAAHARVWPEVLKQIKDSNIEDCKACCLSFCAFWEQYAKQIPAACVATLLMSCSSTDSIFHDPETHILFASFKYVGYNWAGDSKNTLSSAQFPSLL
jgi:L-rhamnose mutarotase